MLSENIAMPEKVAIGMIEFTLPFE